jgi:inward rectifier potassium channel
MSWPQFLGLLLLLYFVSNVAFGLVYAAFGEGGIVDTAGSTPSNVLVRGFFFSVQTFATIGYGNIHPMGVLPNLVVTLESYYSLIINALITGIAFARFAKPTARILFSDVAVIAPYRDNEGLMFRLVNGRNNQLINVRLQVLFARFVNEDGRTVRRFDQLDLERNQVTFFPLSWTVVHPITRDSPLWGLDGDDFVRTDGELLILLTATDETFAQQVHTRSSYKPTEIQCGAKFVSIYNEMSDGDPISIDIRKLSKTEPAERPVKVLEAGM